MVDIRRAEFYQTVVLRPPAHAVLGMLLVEIPDRVDEGDA